MKKTITFLDNETLLKNISDLYNKFYQTQEGVNKIGKQIFDFANQFGFEKAQMRADAYMFSKGYTKFRREKTIMITPAEYRFYYSTPDGKFIMVGVDATKEWEEWWAEEFKTREEMWCSIADHIRYILEIAQPNKEAERHLKEAVELCGKN